MYSLSDLPTEVLETILLFSQSKDLISFTNINNVIYTKTQNEHIWQSLCEREDITQVKPLEDIGYKNLFFNSIEKIGYCQVDWLLRYSFTKHRWQINFLALMETFADSSVSISQNEFEYEFEHLSSVIDRLTRLSNRTPLSVVSSIQISPENQNFSTTNLINIIMGIKDGGFPESKNVHNFLKTPSHLKHLIDDDDEEEEEEEEDNNNNNQNNTQQISPCILMFKKPFSPYNTKGGIKSKSHNTLFLRTYGIDHNIGVYDESSNESINREWIRVQKSLATLTFLLSSTVLICKDNEDTNWCRRLDYLLEPIKTPPIFSSQNDMPSLLLCNIRSRFHSIESSYNNNNNNNNNNNQNNNNNNNNKISRKQFKSCAFDVLQETKQAIQQYHRFHSNRNQESTNERQNIVLDESSQNYPFVTYLVNWFGRVFGIHIGIDEEYNNNESKHSYVSLYKDLWVFMKNLMTIISFGWPFNRWDKMCPTGNVYIQYLYQCIEEINSIHPHALPSVSMYQSVIHDFAYTFLHQEMLSVVNFFEAAMEADLSSIGPTSMEELFQLSAIHSKSAILKFSHSVSKACFEESQVELMCSHLQSRILSTFRTICRRNVQNSRRYCENIYDACFKWIQASCELQEYQLIPEYFPDSIQFDNNNIENNNIENNNNNNKSSTRTTITTTPFWSIKSIDINSVQNQKSDFRQRFNMSMKVYLEQSRGVSKYDILYEKTVSIMNHTVFPNFPHLRKVCLDIIQETKEYRDQFSESSHYGNDSMIIRDDEIGNKLLYEIHEKCFSGKIEEEWEAMRETLDSNEQWYNKRQDILENLEMTDKWQRTWREIRHYLIVDAQRRHYQHCK